MKLKKIVENLNKMPSTLKGFNESPKLSPEQKRKLMEMVSQYNALGQKLRMENALIETATALSEISELAETYACNEASDWFATEVVKQDFKRARGISETFQKLARECHGKVQQLNALYEDMGHILGRYYEIADPMQEVAPNPADIKGQRGLPNAQPQTVMQEVKPNDKNIKSQRDIPHTNGPATVQVKEVSVNDKNIKSQRNLPSGGPAPSQVKESNPTVNKTSGTHLHTPAQGQIKEVDVDSKHANIKSQRELPRIGGPATPQLKEVDYNESNLQSQRELPQGGPSSCECPKPENPNVPVKVAGVGEMNLQGQREKPQGGPAPAQVKEVAPNTSNLQSQRTLPRLGDILKSIK